MHIYLIPEDFLPGKSQVVQITVQLKPFLSPVILAQEKKTTEEKNGLGIHCVKTAVIYTSVQHQLAAYNTACWGVLRTYTQ